MQKRRRRVRPANRRESAAQLLKLRRGCFCGNSKFKMADGEAALTFLQNNPTNPHIVVCDYQMPGMDGMESCKKFHEQYGFKTPFILYTASFNIEVYKQALIAGVTDYLCKEHGSSFLIQKIRYHVDRIMSLIETKAINQKLIQQANKLAQLKDAIQLTNQQLNIANKIY